MSKRIFQVATWTPTAQADGVLSGAFQAIKAGLAADILQIMEIYEGGQAGASSVNAMVLARSSTLAITPTALALPNSDSQMNSNTQAPGTLPVAFVAAGTAPNRSPAATVARLGLTFNAFGGIVRWVAAPGEEWTSVGTATTSNSETVLSQINVGTGGLMGSNFVYELL